MDKNRTQIKQIILINTDLEIKINNIKTLRMVDGGNLRNGLEFSSLL